MDKRIQKKIDKYYDEDKLEKVIELINGLPDKKRDYDTTYMLAVTYNNLKQYNKALEVINSVADEGQDDSGWYYCVGYSYYYQNEMVKAADAFAKALELIKQEEEPNGEFVKNYIYYLNGCHKYMLHMFLDKLTSELDDISKPIEIIWSQQDEEYKIVKGVVDLGYMGIYTIDNMSVDFDNNTLEAIFKADENDNYDAETYLPLKPYLREDMTKDEIAKGLTSFYNARIADIKKHQTALNQTFLAYILDDLSGCGFPLWEECTDYIIKDKMPECDEDDLCDVFYSDEAVSAIDNLFGKLYEKSNNGDVDSKTPAEDIFNKYFPMFDLHDFLIDIDGEYLNFSNANISFQCSGDGQAVEIACGAYAQITINNSFYDWHNH